MLSAASSLFYSGELLSAGCLFFFFFFPERNALKCNQCETVFVFLGSSMKHPLPARPPGCGEGLVTPLPKMTQCL